jgi:hypothetical protein
MGRTACIEPQCLYKGALYLYLLRYDSAPVRKHFQVDTELLNLLGYSVLLASYFC